jgi:Tfp pilus assembly protein PilF
MENLKKQIQSILDNYKSGNLTQAELLCKKLITKNPNVVFLYNLLGLICVGQKKIDLAQKYYEKGIEIDPNFAEIYNNLGLLFTHHKSDNDKAENFFKKSIFLNKNIPEPYNNLGSLYKSLDKNDKALNCFKKSIEINQNFFHAYHNIGVVYIHIGKFDEAKKNFFKAIEINPHYTRSHRSLSRLIKYTNHEKHLSKLNKVYSEINVQDIEGKTNIAFALGKAYEDIKNFDKSFNFYKQANTIYQKKINISMKSEKDDFFSTKNTFHKKIYEKYLKSGSSDASTIFILGMPRSGTTLVEQILSNHSKVFGAGEQDIINEIVQKKFTNKKLSLFLEPAIDSNKNILKEIGDEYLNKMKNISNNSERSTDKLPFNFFWIGLIKLILPKSKIIHCFRDPKDNCFSIYKNHFQKGTINYSYDLNNIVEYYNLYSDLMNYWNKLFPNFMFNIKYESLVSNTKNEIINMLNFCDLVWDDNCLNFYKNKRSVKTASNVQVRSKIYNSSIGFWKNYEKHLKVYFDKLNT